MPYLQRFIYPITMQPPPPSCNFSCEVTHSTVKVCKNTRKTSVFFHGIKMGEHLVKALKRDRCGPRNVTLIIALESTYLIIKRNSKCFLWSFGLTKSYKIIFNRISKEIPGFHLCKKYPTFSHLPRSSRNWKNVLFEKLIFVFLHRNCYFLVRTGTGFQWNHAKE